MTPNLYSFSQALREIDELLKYLDKAENEINTAEPLSTDPETLAVQLRDHKVSHSLWFTHRESLNQPNIKSCECRNKRTINLLFKFNVSLEYAGANSRNSRSLKVCLHTPIPSPSPCPSPSKFNILPMVMAVWRVPDPFCRQSACHHWHNVKLWWGLWRWRNRSVLTDLFSHLIICWVLIDKLAYSEEFEIEHP